MKKLIFTVFIALYMLTAQAQPVVIGNDSLIVYDTIETMDPTAVTSPHSSPKKVGLKLVYWIHGLAGSNKSWESVQLNTEDQTGNAVPGYPERVVQGYAPNYQPHEDLHIFNLAKKVNQDYLEIWRSSIPKRDSLDVRKNFIIAHSQGGILSRAIRYMNVTDSSNNPWQFGALATFNSPHGGTTLFNASSKAGAIQNWINRGCEALTAAEINIFVDKKWWLDFLIKPKDIQDFSSKGCKMLEKTVLPILIKRIRKPVLSSYDVGSSHLKTLSAFASQDTMSVVTFYGVEEEPVLWRMMHSMTLFRDSSIAGNPLTYNPFGLDADQELPDYINNNINVYNALKLRKLVHVAMLKARPVGRYFYYLKIKELNEKATIYNNAARWLQTANLHWKHHIGARKFTYEPDGYYCTCYGFGREITKVVQNPANCDHDTLKTCVTTLRTKLVFSEEPSDGVVPVSSQVDYPSQIKPIELTNTNHMQARNATTTRIALNRLFNGLYGSEFELDEK